MIRDVPESAIAEQPPEHNPKGGMGKTKLRIKQNRNLHFFHSEEFKGRCFIYLIFSQFAHHPYQSEENKNWFSIIKLINRYLHN